MKLQDLDNLVTKIYEEGKALRAAKGHDYSGEKDTLANFKKVASILNVMGYQVNGTELRGSDVAVFFQVIKMMRKLSLRDREPANEGKIDTFKDLLGYIYCEMGCLEDEERQRIFDSL